jgi:hypothetical protein
MMTNTSGDITITFNSDLSGDIVVFNNITTKTDTFTYEQLREYWGRTINPQKELEWVKSLFADVASTRIIAAVEQMSDTQVLKFEKYFDMFLDD